MDKFGMMRMSTHDDLSLADCHVALLAAATVRETFRGSEAPVISGIRGAEQTEQNFPGLIRPLPGPQS
jgi:hypothetical protein